MWSETDMSAASTAGCDSSSLLICSNCASLPRSCWTHTTALLTTVLSTGVALKMLLLLQVGYARIYTAHSMQYITRHIQHATLDTKIYLDALVWCATTSTDTSLDFDGPRAPWQSLWGRPNHIKLSRKSKWNIKYDHYDIDRYRLEPCFMSSSLISVCCFWQHTPLPVYTQFASQTNAPNHSDLGSATPRGAWAGTVEGDEGTLTSALWVRFWIATSYSISTSHDSTNSLEVKHSKRMLTVCTWNDLSWPIQLVIQALFFCFLQIDPISSFKGEYLFHFLCNPPFLCSHWYNEDLFQCPHCQCPNNKVFITIFIAAHIIAGDLDLQGILDM